MKYISHCITILFYDFDGIEGCENSTKWFILLHLSILLSFLQTRLTHLTNLKKIQTEIVNQFSESDQTLAFVHFLNM